MIEDGSRLSFSIDDKSFQITDTLTGKLVIWSNGNFNAFNIDKQVVLTHVKNLQEALMTFQPRHMFRPKQSLSRNAKLVIREDEHFHWTLGLNGKTAVLSDNTYYIVGGFGREIVLRRINRLLAEVMSVGEQLSPKHDIVRRISDAGLLVWAYNGHSVVCYEKDVMGSTMSNCLIDGVYFKLVFVSVSDEDDRCTLFNTQLGEIITYPLDNSIKVFYKADEDLFD